MDLVSHNRITKKNNTELKLTHNFIQ